LGGSKIAVLSGFSSRGMPGRVCVVRIFGRGHQRLPFGQLVGEGALLCGQIIDPLAELWDVLSHGQGELVTLFLSGEPSGLPRTSGPYPANAQAQIARQAARVRRLETKLAQLPGEEAWRESGLGAPAEVDQVNRRIAEFEQTNVYLTTRELPRETPFHLTSTTCFN
jgi:hypothetical protein